MKLILGVDGGGSKTLAKVKELATQKSAEFESGSSDYKSVGIQKAKNNINVAVLNAIKKLNLSLNIEGVKIDSSCFGLSGYDCSSDYNIYRRIVFNKELKKILLVKKTFICNDTRIGLIVGSNNKNSVIIVCGTGSTCFGMNEDREEARVNGWDYILGDQGSGYIIGLKSLQALMKFYDGRDKATKLKDTIFEQLNINDISSLVNWVYNPFLKEKISSLAIAVEKTAELGDKVSIDILKFEALEALKSIKTVVNRLKIGQKYFDCILAGSIFNCEKFFKSIIVKKLFECYPNINIKHLDKKPVEGALIIAKQNL